MNFPVSEPNGLSTEDVSLTLKELGQGSDDKLGCHSDFGISLACWGGTN